MAQEGKFEFTTFFLIGDGWRETPGVVGFYRSMGDWLANGAPMLLNSVCAMEKVLPTAWKLLLLWRLVGVVGTTLEPAPNYWLSFSYVLEAQS